MKFKIILTFLVAVVLNSTGSFGQQKQWVEGFDTVVFHHNGNRSLATLDFRGMAKGYMTASWWASKQMENNMVSWKTALVPEKKATTFVFIGANAVVPAEFTRGPLVKLSVNGRYAITFAIGSTRDFVCREGAYELRYITKRVEYPYFNTHRQFQLDGNSGVYQLSVPAEMVEAGKAVELKAELLPFERWHNGWFMVKARKDVLKQTMESMQGENESLRKDLSVVALQTQILATQVYSKMLGTDKFEHNIIYTDGYKHLHPADLVKLQNGDLLLTSREGTEHLSNDGDVIILRSKDGGKTWGEKQVIAGIKDMDEREACGLQLKDGTIVLSIFYNALYFADGSYKVWNPGKTLDSKFEKGKPRLGTYVITSNDNGYTWSEPNFMNIKKMPFSGIEGPTDAPIQMPDGSILMAAIGYGLHGDAKNEGSVLLRSVDKGLNWTYISTIANDPGGKMKGFVEPGIVRTKTGRLVIGLRNHLDENAIFMTYSDDDGKTWVPVFKTDMIGHPVDLVELSDGRLMASYGIRPAHSKPSGVRACFSNDNGKTWDIKTEVQLRNDFMNLDVGYPESLQMADGRVLTVYYFNLLGKYYLGSTTWKP